MAAKAPPPAKAALSQSAPAKAPAAAPAKAALTQSAPAKAGDGKAAWVQGGVSWQAYANIVKKDPNVKDAGIYGLDESTWWNGDLKVTRDEIKNLVGGWKDSSKFQASGILVGGVKYMFLSVRQAVPNADPKKAICAQVIGRKGPASVLLVQSGKSIIVTITKDGANPANVTTNEQTAIVLKGKGF